MTAVATLLAGIRAHHEGIAYADDIPEGGNEEVPEDYERHYCHEDGEDWPCPTIRTAAPRLIQALEAVAALHKPETRWMPYKGADVSYATQEEAIEACEDLDIGVAATVLVPFDLCAHCKVIEEAPCEGECTKEAGYRESLWPCPTITAVTAALGGGE